MIVVYPESGTSNNIQICPFLFCFGFCGINGGKYDGDIMHKSLQQLLHRKRRQIVRCS